MKQKRWVNNGQSIIFGKPSDNLLNGQHRLKAIVQSGVTVECTVTWGVEDSAFDTIDDGSQRSLGDVFAIKGEGNPKLLGSGVRFLWVYATGQIATRDLRKGKIATKPLLEQTLERHPGLRQSTKFYAMLKARPGGLLISAGMAIGLHYLFALVDEKKADEFFNVLQSGVGLTEGHPILLLRARLISGKKEASMNLTSLAIYFFTVTTWNAFVSDQPLKRLAFVQDAPPPEIDNLPKKFLKDLL
jgi:hypothetical protein